MPTFGLVLSTFCGADLFGAAFEDAGYCVVKIGDPVFGQRGVETFHPPPGAFGGVIGGPPCQMWAQSHNLGGDKGKHENLIPEFERIVSEAQPQWWLMENVVGAPVPEVEGYHSVDHKLYAYECGNPQRRRRRFTFGSKPPVHILWPSGEKPPRGALTMIAAGHDSDWLRHRGEHAREVMPTLLANSHGGMAKSGLPDSGYKSGAKVMPTLTCTNSTQRARQGEKAARTSAGKTCFTLGDYRYGFGLPPDWDAPALLKEWKFRVLGNAVPMQVGRALAQAVLCATSETP